MSQAHQLSNLQIELLKLYANNVSDEELLDIKTLLAAYFAHKVDKDLDQLWEDGTIDMDKITEWKNAHLRTPYKK